MSFRKRRGATPPGKGGKGRRAEAAGVGESFRSLGFRGGKKGGGGKFFVRPEKKKDPAPVNLAIPRFDGWMREKKKKGRGPPLQEKGGGKGGGYYSGAPLHRKKKEKGGALSSDGTREERRGGEKKDCAGRKDVAPHSRAPSPKGEEKKRAIADHRAKEGEKKKKRKGRFFVLERSGPRELLAWPSRKKKKGGIRLPAQSEKKKGKERPTYHRLVASPTIT